MPAIPSLSQLQDVLQRSLGSLPILGSRARLHAELARVRRELDATERYVAMHANPSQWPAFAAMSEMIDDAERPPLDRRNVDESTLSERQRLWRRQGYLLLENFLPPDLIAAYVAVREKWPAPGGWGSPSPYMQVPEIRDLALHPPLLAVMRELFGADMVLHLNLTGFISTERDWHQDDYLNPPTTNGWYVATWMALDDIDPNSGPFEYVPESHRWPTLRGDRVRSFLPPMYARAAGLRNDHGHWASWSEDYVARSVARQIEDTGLAPRQFLGKKGDVLLWHACVAHRGSRPLVPGTPRRALISHYTERTRMGGRQLMHPGGGRYLHSDLPLY
jgi:phytanoyl-CoA dioxygenase PhyH